MGQNMHKPGAVKPLLLSVVSCPYAVSDFLRGVPGVTTADQTPPGPDLQSTPSTGGFSSGGAYQRDPAPSGDVDLDRSS